MRNLFKIAIIKSLLLLAGFYAYGQSYFESSMDIDSMPGLFTSVERVDSFYYALGDNLNLGKGSRELTLTKYDIYGNEVWTTVVGDSGQSYSSNDVFFLNNRIYAFGSFLDSSSSFYQIFLLKFDTNGAIKNTYTIGSNQLNEKLHSVTMISENEFLLVGTTDESASIYSDIYTAAIDSSGFIQWEKRIGKFNADDFGGQGVKLKNGNYLISGVNASIGTIPDNIYLFEYNTNGTIAWDTNYGHPVYNDFIPYLSILQNGSFLLSGGYRVNSSEVVSNLINIDKKGGVIWQKYYQPKDLTAFNGRPLVSQTGTFIIPVTFVNDSAKASVSITNFTPRGDTIWTRNYSVQPDKPNYAYDIIHTPDSGYVFVGSNHPLSSDGWIKKLDCMVTGQNQNHGIRSFYLKSYILRHDYV